MHASPAKANTRFCTAKSMIDEFKRLINSLNLGKVWEETIQADPVFPVMLERTGLRGVENGKNGSQESWKASLQTLTLTITAKFLEQLSLHFENLEKFRWMDLIHPTKIQ